MSHHCLKHFMAQTHTMSHSNITTNTGSKVRAQTPRLAAARGHSHTRCLTQKGTTACNIADPDQHKRSQLTPVKLSTLLSLTSSHNSTCLQVADKSSRQVVSRRQSQACCSTSLLKRCASASRALARVQEREILVPAGKHSTMETYCHSLLSDEHSR